MKKYYWVFAVLAIVAAVFALILMVRALGIEVNFIETLVTDRKAEQPITTMIGKIELKNVSDCTSISRGEVYTNKNDLVTDKTGNVYLTQKENAVSSAEITICKHLIVSAENIFSDSQRNYAVEYYPSVETIALANMNDGVFPVLALYNIPSGKLSEPKLPELNVDGARWEVSTAYDENFAYVLYYPAVDGGCSTNECYQLVIAENKKLRKSVGMYLLRSDGVQVKLADSTPEGQLKLGFSYNGEKQSIEVIKITDQSTSVFKELVEKLY